MNYFVKVEIMFCSLYEIFYDWIYHVFAIAMCETKVYQLIFEQVWHWVVSPSIKMGYFKNP